MNSKKIFWVFRSNLVQRCWQDLTVWQHTLMYNHTIANYTAFPYYGLVTRNYCSRKNDNIILNYYLRFNSTFTKGKSANSDLFINFNIFANLNMLTYLNIMPVLNHETWSNGTSMMNTHSILILYTLWYPIPKCFIPMSCKPVADSVVEYEWKLWVKFSYLLTCHF